MAKKSDAPPRYYHVEIVLGDRDDDLRTWCWNNPGLRGRAIRDALRDWIATHPGAATPATTVTPRQKPGASSAERLSPFREAPRAAAQAHPRPPAAPVVPVTPPPSVVPPAPAAAPPPDAEPTPPPPDMTGAEPITAAAEPPAEPGKVSDEARARLKRMLAGNKDFI